MSRFASLVLVLLFSSAAYAQTPTRTFAGVVQRSDTLAPIPNAAVVASGQAAVTDKDGKFSLTLAPGKVSVEVTAEGFFLVATTVDLTDHDVLDAQFTLAANATLSTTVDVVGRAPTVSPAATPVAPTDVLKTAGSLDNVFRTLQTLPGVAATQDFSSRLTVRGGAPDQNLTVMDGVEIHDPYRLFGLTSAFNPETIRRFELATGGFSAKYGDRLSSLLVIENRDGDGARRFGGTASLSATDANFVTEGGWKSGQRGSWLLTARRTYYDLVASKVAKQDFPGFNDVQGKGTWEWNGARKLTVFGLRSRQSAALNIDDDNARGEFDNTTDNDLTWARFDSAIGSRGHSMTVAGYSNTRQTLGVSALFQNKGQRSNAPEDAFGTANVTFTQELNVADRSVRQEFAWSLGAHTIEAGGELHHLTTKLKFVISGDRNTSAANGSSVQGGVGLPDLLDSTRTSTRGGVWLIDTWRLGTHANLEGGVRVDRIGLTEETTLSPRLALSWVLSPTLSVRAGIGQYTQSPGYEKSAQSDYVLDYSAVPATTLKSERALLTSIGVERGFASGLSAKVEAYYKTLSDGLIGRLETETERRARIAKYDFPAALASSIPTDPIITTTPTNDGKGRAYGLDVLVSRMTAPTDARLRGWISYTWGKAEREAYGRTYPFEYDRRHAIAAVLTYRLSDRWELAATSRWATGFPRTAPLGLRVASTADTSDIDRDGNTTELIPLRDSAGRLVYQVNYGGVANLNTSRLPDFARTDVRATWRPRGADGRWEFYLEVLNILNRKNAGQLQAELAYDPTSTTPKIVEKADQSVPRLPTIGLRWRF